MNFLSRLGDSITVWRINRAADRIIRNGHTPEMLKAADKRWRNLA